VLPGSKASKSASWFRRISSISTVEQVPRRVHTPSAEARGGSSADGNRHPWRRRVAETLYGEGLAHQRFNQRPVPERTGVQSRAHGRPEPYARMDSAPAGRCGTRLDCPAVAGARSRLMAGPAGGSVTRAAWLSRSTWGARPSEGVTAVLGKRPPRFAVRPSADMPPFYPWGMSGPFTP